MPLRHHKPLNKEQRESVVRWGMGFVVTVAGALELAVVVNEVIK